MGLRRVGLEESDVELGDPELEARALRAARAFLATLPAVSPGGIRRCSLHWSATPHGWARERAARGLSLPYNVVVDRNATGDWILVSGMHPVRNARRLTLEMQEGVEYCASIRGRNSHAVSASIAAMDDASPSAFGAAPIDAASVELLCASAAALCARYGIDARAAEACYTHAEAALWDGYFGTGDDERWDMAVLEPGGDDVAALGERAVQTGNLLRARIAAYVDVVRVPG